MPPSSTLPEAAHAAESGALAALLRRLADDKRGRGLKTRAVELLRRNTGETTAFAAVEPTAPAAAAGWSEYVAARFPGLAPAGSAATAGPAGPDRLGRRRRRPRRGRVQGPGLCELPRRPEAIGPDLSGAGSRYGRRDRWTAILDPSRDVPSRYRTEVIVTADGNVLEGLAVYQSVDGVTLRDAQGRTWRVESKDVLERSVGANSLMPSGVMDDADDADWADLDAYLRSL